MKLIHRIQALVLIVAILLAIVCIGAQADSVLRLPDALQIVDEEAFFGDTSLEQVILPEHILEIRTKHLPKAV